MAQAISRMDGGLNARITRTASSLVSSKASSARPASSSASRSDATPRRRIFSIRSKTIHRYWSTGPDWLFDEDKVTRLFTSVKALNESAVA
jgi:hypothetical protein